MRTLTVHELENVEGGGNFWKWFKCGAGIAMLIIGVSGIASAGVGAASIAGGVLLMNGNCTNLTAEVEADGIPQYGGR